jgi:mRNA interferase YafQ
MKMTVKEFQKAIAEQDGTIYRVYFTRKFEKHLARSYRRNLDLELLRDVIHILAKGETLAAKYRPHTLVGYGTNVLECHIKPDWLLVWQQKDDELILILLDTGSHSDLFR